MILRNLLDWRVLLIMSHRWLGIVLGILFVIWCISGIVLMYAGIPTLKNGERMLRMNELDLSTVQYSPAAAFERAGLEAPYRLRVSMNGERPVYRFQTGPGSGKWVAVWADTGERMAPMDPAAAMEWLKGFRPDYADSLRYVSYVKESENNVRIPAIQGLLPMHRIAIGDAAGTEYYIPENGTGDAVVKIDRMSRLWGFMGYTLHRYFWWRQDAWYTTFLIWISWMGIVLCSAGLVLGIWRYSLKPRFRNRGNPSHTPYKGIMKWHHYAGLTTGLFVCTWVFSGTVDIPAMPGIQHVASPYLADFTQSQLDQGGRNNQGASAEIDLGPISIDSLRQSRDAVAQQFVPKELEMIEVAGEPYFLSYEPPTEAELADYEIQHGLDGLAVNLDQPHVMVSALNPGRGAFRSFDRDLMLRAALAAMPGVEVLDATWIDEYDNYYYYFPHSFNLGLMKPIRTLPALRVKFDDPQGTWLYMSPSHGQMVKSIGEDRVTRWALYGLHALDFSFLYGNRPLWDIVMIVLMAGISIISVTTLLPAYRRVRGHVRRFFKWLAPGTKRARTTAPMARMDSTELAADDN